MVRISSGNKGVSDADTPRRMKVDTYLKGGHSPPLISFGKREKEFLIYIKHHSGEVLNKKEYSRQYNIPRASIYRFIFKLESLGMIYKVSDYSYRITDIGVTTLSDSSSFSTGNDGVRNSRKECPKRIFKEAEKGVNLSHQISDGKGDEWSQHFTRFSLPICDKKGFMECRISELNPIRWKRLDLRNMVHYYIYFEDATLIIFPKVAVIRIHDVVSDSSEENLLESMNKALKYVDLYRKIGIVGDRLILDNAHFARVESFLSEFLEKFDSRYFLDLGDGKKFWVDHSPGKVAEDEVNDFDARKRIDTVLEDAINSDSLLSDVDKMKEVLGLLIKLKVIDAQVGKSIYESVVPKDRPDYMG